MADELTGLLLALGPWLILVMAAAETAFVTGLVVPAGVATAAGAFLAAEGLLSLPVVAGAAVLGAVLGDASGFWLGRRFGRTLLEGEGRLRSLARRHEPRAARFFGRHPVYSVSVARMVSFVRTLMPWMAGTSRLSFPRFLAYDLAGIGAWVAMYVSAGYLAGESWRWVSGALGTGWAVAFGLVGLAAWIRHRRRVLRDPSTARLEAVPAAAGEGTAPAGEEPC